jgi:secreted PhoX family phosphatase
LGFLGFQTSCSKERFLLDTGSNELPLVTEIIPSTTYGYGPLYPQPNGILELPKGFSYKVISTKGTKMDDGFYVPGNPDGMATFPGSNGKTIIIRNRENSLGGSGGPFGPENELLTKINSRKIYDKGKGIVPAMGGTTTMIYDESTMTVEKQYLSLAGTVRNCAGGATPWNSWITCEETVDKAGSHNGFAEKDHGYNFEVPASENIFLSDPVPLKAMGRFNHEAVAVDPNTGIVYQTEDVSNGLIYRFIPNKPGKLERGGKLQALAILEKKCFDTRNWPDLTTEKFQVGHQFSVYWVDIHNVTSPDDSLRYQGFEKGAARFARGEGMWFGKGELYFACTNGGNNAMGQVFKYIPSPYEGTRRENQIPGKLELFVEPNNTDIATHCDNLTVAPWGDIVLCEDVNTPYIIGITPKGEFYRIAKNIGFNSEFTGSVFSPSGKTLFINIQNAGITLAITGPWLANRL